MKNDNTKTIISALVMIAAIVALVMTGHWNILLAIFMIGLVICFHEFGHFIMARVNGVTVKEFSLGMGPRLVSKTIRGTKWSIKLLPFGGSCLMLGEDDPGFLDPEGKEEKDDGKDAANASEDSAENSSENAAAVNASSEDANAAAEGEKTDADKATEDELRDESEGSFRSKNVWQRISIVFAGPFFNFILAFLFACIILGSIGYDPAIVTSVDEQIAAETGLQAGDVITEYEDHTVNIGRDIALYESLDGVPEEVTIKYKRDGKEYETTYKTKYDKRYVFGISYYLNQDGKESPMVITEVSGAAKDVGILPGDYVVGINGTDISTPESFQEYIKQNPVSDTTVTLELLRDGARIVRKINPTLLEEYKLGFSYNTQYREKVGFFNVLRYGYVEVKYWMKATVKSLVFLAQGKAKKEDVGGAVRVVSEVSDVVDQSYHTDGIFYAILNLINWAILLSANLGVMNLLPIPALDGGRLLFLLIEAVRGKPVPAKVEGYVTLVGFVLLMILMVFILFNDISNVFGMLLPAIL
ncbi:MAG: RIP metalloprotease RseP [Lachnospiraceae bacterium]|nr:RIP metalloprotease RseP [Lachnospiraceae bacterium]